MKNAGGKAKLSVARVSGNEQKLRSAGIFQTLFAKCAFRIPTRSLDSRASILVAPLFSYSYELLFPQPLSFHNHPHCPGVGASSVKMPSSGATRADDLYRFQAGLAFLLGASFADPYHAASHGAKRVLVKDELDRLPASQPEISVQPEPALRGVDHQTGNSRLASFEVDNQAGALLRRNPPQAAAFGNGKGGHAFAPRSSDYRAGIVSCRTAVPAATARACRSGKHSPARPTI